MGKTRWRKKKTVKRATELTDDSIPRSFVFHRGEVGKTIHQLIADMRHLMEPYTATNLKVTKGNVFKDFVNVAGPYGISHFIMFSKTDIAPYMKICCLPRGPTLTFRINEYSLMRDLVAALKRPKTIGTQFKMPPLVVLNKFDNETMEMKLMTTVFQNMFPSIKIQKVKLSEIRRCAMFNFDKESGCIDFRHYNIEVVPIGVSRGVQKLLKNKIPNLGSLNDISDFMTGGAYFSESEGEEPVESQVTLPQRVRGCGNMKAGQSMIRLTELGPRLRLVLIKIEEGLYDGKVLFHRYVEKTGKEKRQMKKKKAKERKLKEERKCQQEANISRKEKEKKEHKERCLAGMKRKVGNEQNEEEEDNTDIDNEEQEDSDEDDDVEYFQQEVGEEPEDHLFQKKTKKQSFHSKYIPKKKKLKTEHKQADVGNK